MNEIIKMVEESFEMNQIYNDKETLNDLKNLVLKSISISYKLGKYKEADRLLKEFKK